MQNIPDDMVLVPEGWFLMGSTKTEILEYIDRQHERPVFFKDELPQHKVLVDAFLIDKFPVTNQKYKLFIDETNHPVPQADSDTLTSRLLSWNLKTRIFPAGKGNHPVVFINYQDAIAYCRWAGKRLPTEAEWEKAARGTNGNIYPWGNRWDNSKCNYIRPFNSEGAWEEIDSFKPVGSYPEGVSSYGCHDMSGGVWEWCSDYYSSNYYRNSPDRNPRGPKANEVTKVNTGAYFGIIPAYRKQQCSRGKVVRGGSWFTFRGYTRCAHRGVVAPEQRSFDCGFRCAKNI